MANSGIPLVPPSSPITQSEYTYDIVAKFLDWMQINAPPVLVDNLVHAKEIAAENLWTLEDLKLMSDMKHPLYKVAVDSGIKDGLVRRFREKLQKYKPVYRTEVAAGGLVDLQNGGR